MDPVYIDPAKAVLIAKRLTHKLRSNGHTVYYHRWYDGVIQLDGSYWLHFDTLEENKIETTLRLENKSVRIEAWGYSDALIHDASGVEDGFTKLDAEIKRVNLLIAESQNKQLT